MFLKFVILLPIACAALRVNHHRRRKASVAKNSKHQHGSKHQNKTSVAYIFHGSLKTEIPENKPRSGVVFQPYVQDMRQTWPSHKAVVEALRETGVDVSIYFVTYPCDPEYIEWAKATSGKEDGVRIIPYENSTQFGTVAHILKELPQYDFYFVTRNDITYYPPFADLMRTITLDAEHETIRVKNAVYQHRDELPPDTIIRNGTLLLQFEHGAGKVNDVWMSFAHPFRKYITQILETGTCAKMLHSCDELNMYALLPSDDCKEYDGCKEYEFPHVPPKIVGSCNEYYHLHGNVCNDNIYNFETTDLEHAGLSK